MKNKNTKIILLSLYLSLTLSCLLSDQTKNCPDSGTYTELDSGQTLELDSGIIAPTLRTPSVVKQDTFNLNNVYYEGFVEGDYLMFIGKSLTVSNLNLIDTNKSAAAHRDGIQVIPPSNKQFIGGSVDYLEIQDSHIESNSKLQGIFASDGNIDTVIIKNVTVKTDSYHSISLAGADYVHIENCKTSSPIKLFPLRLFGGDLKGRSIWVMRPHQKAHIKNANVLDLRAEHQRGWNIYNCDYSNIIANFDDPSKTYEQRRYQFLNQAAKHGCTIVENL